jgi:hypothetical protein
VAVVEAGMMVVAKAGLGIEVALLVQYLPVCLCWDAVIFFLRALPHKRLDIDCASDHQR